MSTETEHYLEKSRQTRNIADHRGRIKTRAVRYLTVREKRERQKEMDWINGRLNEPAWAKRDMPSEVVARLKTRRNDIEDDLADNAPPTDIKGETKDGLYQRMKQLEEEIRVGMPTAEVMRRNPPGAVGMNMRWEKANKDKIREWKNIRRLLEPDNDEKDYTNVETLRSSGITQDMAATYMMGAQISGHFAMTPLAKANWPANMPQYGSADSPLRQAERQEIAEEMVADGVAKPEDIERLKEQIRELQTQLDSKTEKEKPKRKKEVSPEARQKAKERMDKYWADKRAAQGQ